jgi:D-arabinose 1-dehydrogenase-like Zn-dependent alcohol dehydrogenase
MILPIPECADNEYKEVAWGIQKPGEKTTSFVINRPKVGDYDVKVEILYCGICHTDVHLCQN